MMKRLIEKINNHVDKIEGSHVLYWMQAAQRTAHNPALMAAVDKANRLGLPVKVLFVLDAGFKDANLRHFTFLYEGLKDVKASLEACGIGFEVKQGSFVEVLENDLKVAAALFTEPAYLDFLRTIRSDIYQKASAMDIPVYEVTTNLIIPVKAASEKVEFAARTIRPKLLRQVDAYLFDETPAPIENRTTNASAYLDGSGDAFFEAMDIDTAIKPVGSFKGGQKAAHEQWESYLKHGLMRYDASGDPAKDITSKMSAYLHFGHISPRKMYADVRWLLDSGSIPAKAAEAYLEQLLIRRELAHNFTYHAEGYDRFETMAPAWALKTMRDHAEDRRDYVYTKTDYLAFATHDPYFNAAMKEMVKTGYMHNTMRMYWGKKIIEWSKTHREAYETILTLNNAYFLDGRDPVSYASVAWCFGRHDQGWMERPVFGKLRYMNDKGLKRKYDIEAYVARCNKL